MVVSTQVCSRMDEKIHQYGFDSGPNKTSGVILGHSRWSQYGGNGQISRNRCKNYRMNLHLLDVQIANQVLSGVNKSWQLGSETNASKCAVMRTTTKTGSNMQSTGTPQ